jgi:YidC/Oxa1 family membrane protein insertase
LRGATFIQGWITDLSAPESILNFGNFTLPFLGWNDLRLLPILFVGSQLLSSKLMQNPAAGASTGQMKFMQYGMPVMFFFMLYNMPSGLLVYWIFSNVLTVGQQYFINQRRKRHATE